MPARLLAGCKREEESPGETGTAEPERWRRGGELGVWEGMGWGRGGIWLNNFIVAARYCTLAQPDGVLIHTSFR